MHIVEVKIRDFKNFRTEQTFNFENHWNFINGKNASGKTTILDAIFWCFTGKMFNTAQAGWKPKELSEENNVPISKVTEKFNTLVEVTFVDKLLSQAEFDQLSYEQQRKYKTTIKRTSFCGKTTAVSFNGTTLIQKKLAEILNNTYKIDLDKLWIFCNPEILFNKEYTDQTEAGKLIFDAVNKASKAELEELKKNMFNLYQEELASITMEASATDDIEMKAKLEKETKIGNKVLSQTNYELSLSTQNENDVIAELEKTKEEVLFNLENINKKIDSKKEILDSFAIYLNQQEMYNKLEQRLSKDEAILRQSAYNIAAINEELEPIEEDIIKIQEWLLDWQEFIEGNPSPRDIKIKLGLIVDVNSKVVAKAKPVIKKITCPVCGNLYVPKTTEPEIKQINESAQQLLNSDENAPFDYSHKIEEYKQQLKVLMETKLKLLNKIKLLELENEKLTYKSLEEIEVNRKKIAEFEVKLQLYRDSQFEIQKLKMNAEELEYENKYIGIMIDCITNYIKDKLRVISDKLNTNLKTGLITLFKLQQNGTIKEHITIIDKNSSAEFSETNTSARIKLGIEVCKVLQEFNNLNLPIFIDEIGRFSHTDWVYEIPNQVIMTCPTLDENVVIVGKS